MTRRRFDSPTATRAQTNLVALVVALVTLASTTGVALALADGALDGADREPLERRAAGTLAERLVAADAPTTDRPNVLNRSRLRSLTAADLDALAPAVRNRSVRVRLGDRTLVSRGDPTAGATTRRFVLVAERRPTTRTLDRRVHDALTLPRRTPRVRLAVDSGPNTTVRTVRANGRVVLHNPSGLDGATTVDLSRYETTTLAVETRGETNATVEITSFPAETTKATLVVSVGD
ncbi:hypothetical protein ACFO0N_11915 [Halobium salinum]|uniref:Uncharacterized protein n=1 Tax=Halobium salinum TaxID=1364940 RepID=A0ABD5PCL7_9EURY|nr:hypothetical protein [Halobium salinum]